MNRSAMKHVTVRELKTMLDAGAEIMLLDVREPDEWQYCRIEGATHIPMGEIPGRLGEVPRDRPIICQCHHGGRSAQVAGFLLQQGFVDVANLVGGIHAWSAEIDPNVAVY